MWVREGLKLRQVIFVDTIGFVDRIWGENVDAKHLGYQINGI